MRQCMKSFKKNETNYIPYPFHFIFKHRKEILNLKNVFFKLTHYYFKKIFKQNISFGLSNILLLYSCTRIRLPIDSLCEMDAIYEREIFDKQWKIDKNSIVVDIGAHVGMFTLKVAKKVHSVIAVEPNTNNFNLLIENITHNKLKNVIPLRLAVSNHIGKSILYFDKSSLGYSLIKKSVYYEEVETITLDNLVKVFGANFIKINAEGAEVKILHGGKNLLKSLNITFAISTHSSLLKEKVRKILKFYGFNVKEGEANIIHADKVKQI